METRKHLRQDWKLGSNVTVRVVVRRIDQDDTTNKRPVAAQTESRRCKKPAPDPIIQKSESPSSSSTHPSFQHKLYKCSQCRKRKPFSDWAIFVKHLRYHAEEKKFKCPKCPRTFRAPTLLSVHLETHSEERQYKCSVCLGTYRSLSFLRIHLMKHRGAKLHKCPVCELPYSESGQLKVHTRSHIINDSYTCPTCPETFPYFSNLVQHMSAHTTGEKTYECPICFKVFAEATTLAAHQYCNLFKDTGLREISECIRIEK